MAPAPCPALFFSKSSQCSSTSLNALWPLSVCLCQQTKLLFWASHQPIHLPVLLYINMVIYMICPRSWMSFLVEPVALRAYADNSWLNIMALNTAITDREVIGFTNQPWLRVYSGTGLYGSYFRDWWAVCQRGGLVKTRKLMQEGESE